MRDSGHEWNDFFIFAASGTDDFAYSAFRSQIEAMANVDDGTFRYADNEREGNLYFLEQDGGVHSGEYTMSISITDYAGSGSKKGVLYEKTLCDMSYFEFSGR